MVSQPPAVSSTAPSDEPVKLTIQTPEGALVAELVVGPRIPVSRVKRQLAGIEGTAAGNQVLLLNGQQLEDGCQPLCNVGATASATFVLTKRAPLLSGQLTVSDLERLLDDEAALQEAIDAYRDNLQYSVAEARTIADAVASALAPGTEALAAALAAEVVTAPDPGDDLLGVRRVLRQRFGRAIRAALEGVREAVTKAHEADRQRCPDVPNDDGEVAAAVDTAEALGAGAVVGARPAAFGAAKRDEHAAPGVDAVVGDGPDVGFLRQGLRNTPERMPDPEVEALRKRPSRGAAPELALHLERRFKACEDASS